MFTNLEIPGRPVAGGPFRGPYQGIKEFSEGVNWSKLTGPVVKFGLEAPPKAAVHSFGTEAAGIAWIKLEPAPTPRTIDILAPSKSKLKVFEVTNQKWMPDVKVTRLGDRLRVVLNPGESEFALNWER